MNTQKEDLQVKQLDSDSSPQLRSRSSWGKFTESIYDRMEDKKSRNGMLGLLAFIALIMPFIGSPYMVEVGTNTFFYMVLCLGLNITTGYCGLLNFGNAAFMAVGAYTTGILCVTLGLNFWLTLPIAFIVTILAAVIIGGPTLKLRSDYLAIVTLGFGEITRMIARNLEITGGASGLVGIPRPEIFGFRLFQVQHFYYVFFILAVLSIFISVRLHQSRFGRALEYIREDEDAAEAMGINTVRFKLLSYIVGALFAGVAGSFFAVKMTAIAPESFLVIQSFNVVLAIVLGGLGKIPGAVLGAFFLVLFPEIFRGIGEMRMLLFGLFLVAVMIFRPQGLWPERRA